jgi:acyl-CoA reductase-like NAD-dependent aldehyde dehydrogenase/ABC-type branched-subunit amino acid transport system ATPase component
MLRVSALGAAYGQHLALADVELTVGEGEIVVILGANGAGKTTLLKAIAGLVPSLPGASVRLAGRELNALPAHEIVEAGVALVPEGRGVFADLSVRDNLLLGANARRARAAEAGNRDMVLALFPRLAERLGQRAGTLSGGEQQMLAIGRALMSSPQILLLDEPSLGLAPRLVGELFTSLERIREAGVGILLVEQNARQSLRVADRGYLIETGRIVGHGEATWLAADPAVQEAYLGSAAEPILLGSRTEAGISKAPAVRATSARKPTNGTGRASPPAVATKEGKTPMFHPKLLIADRDLGAGDSRTFDRLDPVSGAVASRAAAASIVDAMRAADAAAAAFPEWSAMAPAARRALLMKAADALEAKTGEFVEAVVSETGGTPGWAHFNVHLAADMIREAAAMTTQISGEVIPSNRPGSIAMAMRQPVGVILSIAPWNAPVILGVRALAMPLACGNTIVFKASEICPQTHRLIAEAFRDAGLPAGALNVVTSAPEDAPKIVEALIGHPKVRRVNFTGSTRVGRIIAETAGRYLKPVLLELGGKAPMIVLDDADLDAAVNAAAFGAFMHQGQICMSTEKIVAEEKVADAFLDKLVAKASSLPAGNPRQGNVVLGACVSAEAVKRIDGLVADALGKGAKLLAGRKIDGTVMNATVIDGVQPSMRIYEEESFGPVVSVIRVNTEDEAVRIANDTEYGLAAAVFTKDIARGMRIAKRIESGICHINGPTVHDEAQMPFGGVKASGYGRFGGKAAIDEFTELSWITIQTEPLQYPF